MKLRSKILLGVVLCVIAPALFFAAYGVKKRHAVERTRSQLQAEGFKTDISQFQANFPPEAIARGHKALEIDLPMDAMVNDIRAPVYQAATGFRMETSNSVVVAWKEEFYAGAKKRSPWPAVHQTLEKRRTALEAAVAALMEGPAVFDNEFNEDRAKMYSIDYLPDAAKAIAVSVLCNLHYDQRADAWTNLVALTRLVSRSEMPARNERGTRLSLVPAVYSTTWQALQDGGWSDQQLAALEQEWAPLDFFRPLPDSIAYLIATLGHDFDEVRHPKDAQDEIPLSDLLKSPKMIPSVIKETARMTWYRWGNSYDDERNSLLFLRNRELDLRRAIQAATIVEMQRLPSVMNPPILDSRDYNGYPASINVAYEFFNWRSSVGGGSLVGSLAYAADAEIRRRLLLTALGLERFKLRNAAYPEKLDQLPHAAPKTLTDFADGHPLRYRRTDDGHFLLYSIGLDCIDNGGDGHGVGTNQVMTLRWGIPRNTDILWPLPAHFQKAKSAEAEE